MATTIDNKNLSCLSIAVFLFLVTICSSVLASSIPQQPAVKSLFVNEEPLDLELNGDDGDWVIETQPDRILFLSFPDTESSKALKNLLTIYDGPYQVDSTPALLFPSLIDDSVNGKEVVQHRFYSTGNTVNIRFRRSDALLKATIKYQLKIQKAVTCPVNLGGESSCGRIVDDLSCYCATFTKRNWANTKTFCLNNQMTFLRVDTYEEDLAVYRTWSAGGISLWIGASDTSQEGNWMWDNGGRPMYPGYANWLPGEPDNASDQDCVYYWGSAGFGWDDGACNTSNYLFGGVCESQP